MAEAQSGELVQVVALLGAGVVAVPLFRRAGLGSVLGYLAAGLAIGPFGLRLFTDPQAILHVAELGVVMFLFVIGLEMRPSRLWSLRREIFGLGIAQVLVCGLLLALIGIGAGYPPAAAFVAGMGFTLSSTAIVMQVLEERGEVARPAGQRVVSILLLEDLAIVPLLLIVAALSPRAASHGVAWGAVAVAAGSLAALLAAGRWLLNPLFRVLADSHAREVMTAAALLVVLGAALLMELGGLSMAMGAFLAGVMLSESTFRHQLEADIEPFRGILLGLFFIGVGMALDLGMVARQWPLILAAVAVLMVAKACAVYLVARLFRAPHREGVYRAALLAQGGEFAFVLYAAATGAGVLDGATGALLTAAVIISMALTPLAVLSLRWLLPRERESMDGVEAVPEGRHPSLLIIGFGRFGQIVSQPVLARGCDITIIDNDTEMIRAAADFGFKVYYGDGTRIDILRAAGAETCRAILVCVDNAEAASRILEVAKEEFPLVPVLLRAYDRVHAVELIRAGADLQVRETFEAALVFGQTTLTMLGVPEEEAGSIIADVRERDERRLQMQIVGGTKAGRDMILGNMQAAATLRNAEARQAAGT